MPEKMSDRMSKYTPERMSDRCHNIFTVCVYIYISLPYILPDDMPETMSE